MKSHRSSSRGHALARLMRMSPKELAAMCDRIRERQLAYARSAAEARRRILEQRAEQSRINGASI